MKKPKPRPRNLLAATKASSPQPAKRLSGVHVDKPLQTPEAKSANVKLTLLAKKKIDDSLTHHQPPPLHHSQYIRSGQLMEHLFNYLNEDTIIRGIPVVRIDNSIYGSPVITPPNSLRAVAAISIKVDNTSPFQVGWEWLTGTGPRVHTFTNGDRFTELLKQHEHVAETREIIKKST